MITSALLAGLLLTGDLPQADSLVRGDVRSSDGAPIEGANVFLLETLEKAGK